MCATRGGRLKSLGFCYPQCRPRLSSYLLPWCCQSLLVGIQVVNQQMDIISLCPIFSESVFWVNELLKIITTISMLSLLMTIVTTSDFSLNTEIQVLLTNRSLIMIIYSFKFMSHISFFMWLSLTNLIYLTVYFS